MVPARGLAEPERPPCFKTYPKATWDAARGLWRDGDYWFDAKAAQAAVDFFEKHLCLTEGRVGRAPVPARGLAGA
jgi:hypothetical protein